MRECGPISSNAVKEYTRQEEHAVRLSRRVAPGVFGYSERHATDMCCGQGRRILAATDRLLPSRSRPTVCATCKSEARIDGWPSPGGAPRPQLAVTRPGPCRLGGHSQQPTYTAPACTAPGGASRAGASRPERGAGVRSACTVPHIVPTQHLRFWALSARARRAGVSFGSRTWAGVALQDP